MRRFILALSLLPTLVSAEPRLALTRGSEAGFRELIRRTQQGALGGEISNLNARIQKDRVEVELKDRNGGARTLFLRPNENDSGVGFFRVEAGDRATEADVTRLRDLLAKVFRENPFLVEHDGMDGEVRVAPVPISEALHNEGISGAAAALTDHASGPISRSTMLLTASASLLGLALALSTVWWMALSRGVRDLNSP